MDQDKGQMDKHKGQVVGDKGQIDKDKGQIVGD